MRTGDIYRVRLDPVVGQEMTKTRPVVVLNPGDAKSLRLAIVMPVTTCRFVRHHGPQGAKWTREVQSGPQNGHPPGEDFLRGLRPDQGLVEAA